MLPAVHFDYDVDCRRDGATIASEVTVLARLAMNGSDARRDQKGCGGKKEIFPPRAVCPLISWLSGEG
jgi:hypothetical protein